MSRRISTRAFAARACTRVQGGAKLADALSHASIPDILDTMDAHDGARFFILGPYQYAKSAIGQLRLLRNNLVRGQPGLWYSPTEKAAENFADAKYNHIFDALPEMRALMRMDDKTKKTKMRHQLCGDASLFILTAGTEIHRHGYTACDLYLDEPHRYASGWIGQISNRRGTFTEAEQYTETFMSTGLTVGETEGGEAAKIWATTDQRTWHCRCPDCGRLFEPLYLHRENPEDPSSKIVGGLRYDRVFLPTGLIDEKAVETSLVYECPHCHARRKDCAATRALYSGTADAPLGQYVAKNASPSKRCFGWNISAIALRPWLPIVIRFETAQLARIRGDLEPLANCIREEFAGIWDPEKYHRPDEFKRYQHPTPYKMRDEWGGEIKDDSGEPFRFATIDVQQDHYWLTVRKWGKWSQSRQHFTARCLSLSEIALHLATDKVPKHRTFMDSRFDPQRVRRDAAAMGWMTMMGDKEMKDYLHEDGRRKIYDRPKVIETMAGTEEQGKSSASDVVEWLFSKNSALNRLALLRDPESLAPDGTPLWTAASDAPEWYFKHNNAHFRKRVENADGTHHFVWWGQREDHTGDCEAMHMVSAAMARLTGAESIDPPAAKSDEAKPS